MFTVLKFTYHFPVATMMCFDCYGEKELAALGRAKLKAAHLCGKDTAV